MGAGTAPRDRIARVQRASGPRAGAPELEAADELEDAKDDQPDAADERQGHGGGDRVDEDDDPARMPRRPITTRQFRPSFWAKPATNVMDSEAPVVREVLHHRVG